MAPMLRSRSDQYYSNYHSEVDKNGYFIQGYNYTRIYDCLIKGIIEVPVVHCTYLINKDILKDILKDISYVDDSGRYEYVIFSDNLRKKKILQYIDNRSEYGIVTFWTSEEMKQEEIATCRFYKQFFYKQFFKKD